MSTWTSAFLEVNCSVLSDDHTTLLAEGNDFVPGLYVLPEMFSVTVPATLALQIDASGQVHTADNAEIINNSTDTVQVTDITIQGVNGSGWTLANAVDIAAAPVNAKVFSLTVEASGEIETAGSMGISYSAVVPAQSEAVATTDIARVVFTVAWASAV